MDSPDKIKVRVGNTAIEFTPNKTRVGGLIAIGLGILLEAGTGLLYLMYNQPDVFEQDLRLGVLKVAAIVFAIPAFLGALDLALSKNH